MSVLPTLSSSLPMSDWFSQMSQMYAVVQHQGVIIQALQERVAVLESRASIVPPAIPVVPLAHEENVAAKDKDVKKPKKPRAIKKTDATATDTGKKRGRKPANTIPLSSFLREGEQIIARIPLGDRKFDEHSVLFQDGKLVLEDGQTFDHPSTMIGALAKMLEDIGERSTECSRSLNGWGLCSVYRDGKKIALETFKAATATSETSSQVDAEEAEAEAEAVVEADAEEVAE